MKALHISEDISLPLDTATQTIAILARKRVGKTYTASVIAEELIKVQIPIVVLDPTGAWHGLRSSADGKSAGFPVIIIGGEHGDVPLEETAGKVIADLVVDHPGYYVIDFSKFEFDAQIRRFATDFGKRFYFRKEQKRFPMQLIVDEADIVMPQHPQKDQTVMLHTYDNIVRRGGIRGIGMILISQRPAVLNKNVLTQCETLIQLQMTGSQDVDAVEHWTRVHGTDAQRKELLSSIATLQRGEAWIWSPSWLQVFKRIRIRERETFNSSATPKAGEKVIVPQKLAAVDIDKLGEQIKLTVERAKANDPSELKRQITQLKRELDTKPKVEAAQPLPPKEVSVVREADLNAVTAAVVYVRSVDEAQTQLFEQLKGVTKVRDQLRDIADRLSQIKTSPPKIQPLIGGPVKIMPARPHSPTINTRAPRNEFDDTLALGKCERAILTALAQYYPHGRTSVQAAIICGYSSGSGGWNNSLSRLRSCEFITRSNPMQITPEGLSVLGAYEPLPTGDGLHTHWLQRLSKCESAILSTLLEAHPNGMSAEDVAEAAGYAPSSGGFNNALSRLRTLELITRGKPIKASDDLFD